MNISGALEDRLDTPHVLWQALRNVPCRDRVSEHLQSLIQSLPTLEQLQIIIRSKSGHSSGGLSGLKYKHIQNWPLAMVEEAYNCLMTMWTNRTSSPAAWKWKWLVPIPKGTAQMIQDVQPKMLMETRRKLWTGLVVQQVTNSLSRRMWDTVVKSVCLPACNMPNRGIRTR